MTLSDGNGGGLRSAPLADIAWAAGLFEGEGCFNAYLRGEKHGVQMRLGMTDGDVIAHFAAVVGRGKTRGPIMSTHPNHKPIFEWYSTTAADVKDLIDILLPWLGARRRARALEVRAVAELIGLHKGKRTHCPKGHAYAGDNLLVEMVTRNGHTYAARRCRACRLPETRDRMRRTKGITPERFRIKEIA